MDLGNCAVSLCNNESCKGLYDWERLATCRGRRNLDGRNGCKGLYDWERLATVDESAWQVWLYDCCKGLYDWERLATTRNGYDAQAEMLQRLIRLGTSCYLP